MRIPTEKIAASTPTSPNVVVYRGLVTRPRREQQNGHRARAFWFTGLSGSGKSTLAHLVEEELHRAGIRTYAFDGDNVRHGLCGDLSFSREGRAENLRRIGEMVKLFLDAGTVCLTAFISPLAEDRHKVRQIIGEGDFFEIFVKCPLEVCEERDVKGLYKWPGPARSRTTPVFPRPTRNRSSRTWWWRRIARMSMPVCKPFSRSS
jgi:adenylylsulfate kinase